MVKQKTEQENEKFYNRLNLVKKNLNVFLIELFSGAVAIGIGKGLNSESQDSILEQNINSTRIAVSQISDANSLNSNYQINSKSYNY